MCHATAETTWPKQLRLKRSPFYLVTGRLEVNLHPMYLGNLSWSLSHIPAV